jgi:AmmeMemoRadiSam system protein B/AmmeMemoRadiSam system protein A
MDETQERTARTQTRRVHHSTLAGAWYASERNRLAREIEAHLRSVPERQVDNLCALILPHAGYQWSGPTAAHGIRLLRPDAFDRVIVMGPSHRMPLENRASLPEETHFANPLGELALDVDFIESLRRHAVFAGDSGAHAEEHSVQIELPLLQQSLGDFRLVPIVVGQLNADTVTRMAEILRPMLDERTLVVVSSDFTHYGRRFGYVPFEDNIQENVRRLDDGALGLILAKDARGFLEYVRRTQATICGRYPIGILLSMLPGDAQAHLLNYDTSARISGDCSNSVSYAALAFTGRWSGARGGSTRVENSAADEAPSRGEEGAMLLRLAREAMEFGVREGRVPQPDELATRVHPAWEASAGAFVTLRQHGRLRGCIGEIYPTRPLSQAVIHQAVNSALNDRRFAPVTAGELDELALEVSVLTPPRQVSSADDIVLGKHGIILRKGSKSSVFLPKVAIEQKWTRDETLTHLALKAGLPADAWREGAVFEVFEAIVFEERDRS